LCYASRLSFFKNQSGSFSCSVCFTIFLKDESGRLIAWTQILKKGNERLQVMFLKMNSLSLRVFHICMDIHSLKQTTYLIF